MARMPAQRSFGRSVLRVATALACLYAVLLLGAFLLQRRLIYFPVPLDHAALRPAAPGRELLTFRSRDGTLISGLFAPPKDDVTPVVLVAHGNAGNALTWSRYLDPFLDRGLGAFLLDPRGYGLSEGSPDEAGWHADADSALAWLAGRGIAAARVVVVGVSIGSGIAVPLAARHPVRGLILQSPFTSLADAASGHYPFLPCGLLLRDTYDNLGAAPRVTCPVLILHGSSDRTIPVDHARRLAAAFPGKATLTLAPGFDHDDLARWPDYRAALHRFLDALP
jgi:pimeloyl-ACP methyl ester carboxylesterase